MLRAAASSFNLRGFANTSMDDVARSLGVSKPTLYQYFPRKEDILYECHRLSMDHALEGLLIADGTDGTGLDKILAFFRRYMGGMLGEFGSCPVLTNVDSLSPDRRSEVVRTREEISASARALIAIGVADQSIAECDTGLATLFSLGAVNWIPLWYRVDGTNSAEEIVDAFVKFLHATLAPRA